MSQFKARFDVDTVEDVDSSTWTLSGSIIDITGSYNALDVSVGDKMLMRGFTVDSKMVYDRLVITEILGRDSLYIQCNVQSDFTGGLLRADARPATGSFPIACIAWYESLTIKPSFYQHQIDPDYDMAFDNLNLMELEDAIRASTGMDWGEKVTGVDGGYLYEESLTDDYRYICVQAGGPGEAIWKKLPLIRTV